MVRGKPLKLKILEPTEAQIENQILHYLVRQLRLLAWKNPTSGFFDTRRGAFRKHTSPYARNGAPDIICVIRGRFIGFEVKRKGKPQSEAQCAFESDLRANEAHYYVVSSIEETQAALRQFALELGFEN